LKTAEHWNKQPQWPTMPQLAQRSFYDRRRDELTVDEVERIFI
jgi:hypothetical protein